MFNLESLLSERFSWKTSLSLALASNLSYAEAAVVKNTAVNQWKFSSADFLNAGDTQAFIARADGVVLVAFRGTESVADWFGNLRITWSSFDEFGHVHSGFLQSYKLVRAAVQAAAEEARRDGAKFWMTGHSLGGALATLAAVDVSRLCRVSGVHTFGQPRIADMVFQRVITSVVDRRFCRFVNDDDIVTRVPPGFRHVGHLLHFGSDGKLQESESATEAAFVEPRPLTEAEFEARKAEIKAVQVTVAATEGVSSDAVDVTVEGLIPSFSDHRLERYIAAVRRYAIGGSEVFEREVSDVESVFERSTSSTSFERARDDVSGRYPVLLRLRREEWSPPPNLVVNSQFGLFVSAQVTDDDLQKLKANSDVLSIEASRDIEDFDDVEAERVGEQPVAVDRPAIEERGDEALIGIVDSGIDVLHECFRDASGGSRILAFWDQHDSSGPAPITVAPRYFKQTYGTLYLKADIDSFISGSKPVPSTLRVGKHGTHVASIACGRGVGAIADGMAPEAGLVVVRPATKTAEGDPNSLGYSNSHVDAVTFLKIAASGDLYGDVKNPVVSGSMPMAVNVSLGMNAGAHDGLSTLEAAFDSLTGSGRDPGFVIVKSAGNEGGHGIHAQIRAFVGVETVDWESRPTWPGKPPRRMDYFEAWYSYFDDLEFILVDPAQRQSRPVSTANPLVRETWGGNICELKLTELHQDNGANRLAITIKNMGVPIQNGRWQLRVKGLSVQSGNGLVDIWAEREENRGVRFNRGLDQRMTLSIPGTARTVVTVGASNSVGPPELTSSSSYGLTRDRRAKPDLCAPGIDIIGAGAGGGPRDSAVMTGTSMAAPHVTGAIALVFSKRVKLGKPQHNAQQIQQLLMRTANASNGLHHEGFGFGRLDAAKFYIRGIS